MKQAPRTSKTSKWPLFTALSFALLPLAQAQGTVNESMGSTTSMLGGQVRKYQITIQNLTQSQPFSPPVFVTHNASAPRLFQTGQKASFALERIAEEGNYGPLSTGVVLPMLGKTFGSQATQASILPGQSRTLTVSASEMFPLLSGVTMLVRTNDGFTGIDSLNLRELTGPRTLTLMAYDAGTERNNERRASLVALERSGRDPEGGVVRMHPGIRGGVDAPAEWKFSGPVARITITPL